MPRCIRSLCLMLLLSACATAQQAASDLESGLPEGARIKGSVAVQGTMVHGGRQALEVGQKAELVLSVRDTPGFGTVSMWVYDSAEPLPGDQGKQRLHGMLWGLTNAQGQRLCFGLLYAPYLSGDTTYGWLSTADNGFDSRRYARTKRTKGWHQWTFTIHNETDLTVTCDGKPVTGYDHAAAKFFEGATGIFLRGGIELAEPLYVDEVAIDLRDDVLKPRTKLLPSEPRPAPQGVTPLELKPVLAQQHPRLFFTADQLPAIRERCRTTHQDFSDRLLSGANSYLNLTPPTDAGKLNNDQLMQQWGWWRLQTLAFAYVASGEPKYAAKAIDWMTIFAGFDNWGAGAEVNQSMGAANLLSGFACAYDWVYDQLTDAQRATFGDKLAKQVKAIWWQGFADPKSAGYWKADHQNNHRHHRTSGLLLGALAVADRFADGPAYVGAAADQCRAIAASFPPDGSNHEGPSYMPFGYSYVVRCFDALRFTTGVDLFADTEGLRETALYRAHCLLPGGHDVFNFGDCGHGAYYFSHYNFRLASEYQDAAQQALMQQAYQAAPDSFSYYPWMILWYDADLKPADLAEVPRDHWFKDQESAFYRSSWADPNALAVMLKCGPYGGHVLAEQYAKGYVNIAHDHPDANHFMLSWRGKLWATDDGYAHQAKLAAAHNLILVDGQGQASRGGGWLQPIPNMAQMGKIDHYQGADGLFAVRGDASGYYQKQGMQTMRRWLTVVDDQYVILVDDLLSDQPRGYTWLLHNSAEFKQTAPGAYAMTQGDETLYLSLSPKDLKCDLAPEQHEGKPRGQVLRAETPKSPAAQIVAVFAMGQAPTVNMQTDETTIVVTINGQTLNFDRAGGEVTRG